VFLSPSLPPSIARARALSLSLSLSLSRSPFISQARVGRSGSVVGLGVAGSIVSGRLEEEDSEDEGQLKDDVASEFVVTCRPGYY
jgi:hypothetical protein